MKQLCRFDAIIGKLYCGYFQVTQCHYNIHGWEDSTTFVKDGEPYVKWSPPGKVGLDKGVYAIINRDDSLASFGYTWQIVNMLEPLSSPVGVLCKYNKDVSFAKGRPIYKGAAAKPEHCLVIILMIWPFIFK